MVHRPVPQPADLQRPGRVPVRRRPRPDGAGQCPQHGGGTARGAAHPADRQPGRPARPGHRPAGTRADPAGGPQRRAGSRGQARRDRRGRGARAVRPGRRAAAARPAAQAGRRRSRAAGVPAPHRLRRLVVRGAAAGADRLLRAGGDRQAGRPAGAADPVRRLRPVGAAPAEGLRAGRARRLLAEQAGRVRDRAAADRPAASGDRRPQRPDRHVAAQPRPARPAAGDGQAARAPPRSWCC